LGLQNGKIYPEFSQLNKKKMIRAKEKIHILCGFRTFPTGGTGLFFLTLVGVEEGVGSSPPPRPTQFSLLSPET
jgi:hypothetical protein